MKRIFKYLFPIIFMAVCTPLFSGCNDDPEDKHVAMKINPVTLEDFGQRGGVQIVSVNITPAGRPWEAVPGEDWARVTPSGNSFTIEVPEYSGSTDRENTIVISTQGHKDIILPFKQKCETGTAGNVNLSVNVEEVLFYSTGSVKEIEVKCNNKWTASIEYNEGSGWLELREQQGDGDAALSLAAEVNPSEYPRTAVVRFLSGNRAAMVKVTQKGDIIEIEDILGEWDAPDDILMMWQGYYYERVFMRNPHKVTFTREGKNTVSISNVTAINELSGTNYGDNIIATFDAQNQTLHIPSPQKMFPKWFGYALDEAYITPCSDKISYKNNWTKNTQFPPITFSRNEEGMLEINIATGIDIVATDYYIDSEGEYEYIDEDETYQAIMVVHIIREGEWRDQYCIPAGGKWTKLQ